MITGRRWPADAIRSFMLGTPTTLFRVVDGEAVDVGGEPVSLEGSVGLPHPVELTDAQLAAWRGFQHGDPEDAGMIYSVRRRIGSWVLSIGREGLTASGKRPITGSKLEVDGPGFRSDDDRWNPLTLGLASEAHEDLRVLLA